MKFHVVAVALAAVRALAAPVEPINLPTCDASFNLTLGAPNSYLPNPFLFATGVGTTQWTSALWDCRRQEIMDMFQQYELGDLPPAPSSFSASFDNGSNMLTINAGVNGNNISWVVPITYPSNGVPQGGYPAMIALDAATVPVADGVAVLTFDNSAFAVQNNATNRGQGVFYELYGSNATAGAMMAWTWGISRILDALSYTTNTGIDPTHVGVTGCSRDGKGALVAGAFEDRLVLTIPQESGSGGTNCWRLSDAEQASGVATQTLAEIVTENVWFSTEFAQYVNNTNLLPVDHHMLMGLVAPRGLLAIDNSAYAWLGPQSAYGCEVAAGTVYAALNASANFGHSQLGGHEHCMFPAAQQTYLTAFYDKFLFGQTGANTTVNNTDVGRFNWSEYINWDTPIIYAQSITPG